MRAFASVVLIAVSVAACSREKNAPPVSSPAAMPPKALHVAGIRDVQVDLSAEIGERDCQVNRVETAIAYSDDIVRWAFTVKTPECERKKIKVHKRADEIDCTDRHVLQKAVLLPLESCERDDQYTGGVNSTVRLTCSVAPDFDGRRCFKYTIGGQVINGDPEIEIERPRLDGPSPQSTPTPTATP